MKKVIDIIGGGCAGFSLAKNAAELSEFKINFYVGNKENKSRDHFWGFWKMDLLKDAYEMSEKAWHKWKIVSYDQENVFSSENHPYCAVRRYTWMRNYKKILKRHNVQFIDKKVEEKNFIYFANENKLNGEFIFDSRPPKVHNENLLQHFKGIIVESREKVFDDSIATLMDFRCEQSRGLHFIYLLPFSKNKALVESTLFSKKIENEDFYYQSIKNYLSNYYKINKYRVTHQESGVIPMSYISLPNKRSINIGTRGGATRPSTGYTFYFIQKQAQTIVEQLNSKKNISNIVHSKFDLVMDKIFLDVLSNEKNSVSDFFVTMSSNLNGDEFAFFMTGKSRLKIWLKIIKKLPKTIFLLSLIRVLFNG